jgi:hypothetical protein
VRKQRGRLGRLVQLATWGLTVAAIVQELRKPEGQREWNGTVAGIVPYDYRWPTVDRIKARLWDPNGPLIGPQVFGVGWTVNIGKLVAIARQQIGR